MGLRKKLYEILASQDVPCAQALRLDTLEGFLRLQTVAQAPPLPNLQVRSARARPYWGRNRVRLRNTWKVQSR
jgi:hypothetical protein